MSDEQAKPAHASSFLRLRNVRTHNLRGIDLDIPHDRLTVITGLSGSGKSSLAIDTIFAEGQRQYIETLSPAARQLVHHLPRAEADLIDGLLPAVRIDQLSTLAGPRSTVGTLGGIHDFLRLLFARVGTLHCHACGQPVRQQSPARMVAWIAGLPEATRIMLLAPMVRGRKGAHADALERVRKERLVRVRIDGQIHDIDSAPELNPRVAHDIEAVTDRIVVRPGSESRIGESLQLALNLSGGTAKVAWQNPADGAVWQERLFSSRHACPDCDISYGQIEPSTFSFNSPHGACPACDGIGTREQFRRDAVIPDREKSFQAGALVFWNELTVAQKRTWLVALEPIAKAAGTGTGEPLSRLDKPGWEKLWRGDHAVAGWADQTANSCEPEALADSLGREPTAESAFPASASGSFFVSPAAGGLERLLDKALATATRPGWLARLESRRGSSACPACHGARLRPESLAVKLGGLNIAELGAKPLGTVGAWLAAVEVPPDLEPVARPVVEQIATRLGFLSEGGLGYLSLDRSSGTLSGGEYQRVRLAAAIGNGLTSVCFVLDEPSLGLHPSDTQRLIGSLQRLREQGNTVIVVEHDAAIMRAADWLVDLGPGAGRHGGLVMAAGTPDDVARCEASSTGRHLARHGNCFPSLRAPDPRNFAGAAANDWIELRGASGRNLRGIDARFPLGRLSCVTGVSGSGKSTLVHETLVAAIQQRLGLPGRLPAPFQSVSGGEMLTRVILVDQRPPGRSRRGCPATWSGAMDDLRRLYAGTREARRLGFGPSRFSFNSPEGWCPVCRGHGQRRMRMGFLPDVEVECRTCGGSRYNPQSLLCRFRGMTIAEVLRLEVAAATATFGEVPSLHRKLAGLEAIGLGYLQLGQPASTLSGGECQRIKLAAELADGVSGPALYVLDEPTTGLHFDDVSRLVGLLRGLVEAGHTVIVIEHHQDLIHAADWIIDLGPGAGEAGGEIVVAGTPVQVAACTISLTGTLLGSAAGHST